MSDSREESPDWLRSFQPPTQPTIELSSGSESPSEKSHSSDDEDGIKLSWLFKTKTKHVLDADDEDGVRESTVGQPIKTESQTMVENLKGKPKRKRKDEDDSESEGKNVETKDATRRSASEEHANSLKQNEFSWSLSSDSEPSQDPGLARNDIAKKNEASSANNKYNARNENNIDGMLFNPEGKQHKKDTLKVNSPTKQMKEEAHETSEKIVYSIGNGENGTKKSVVKEDSSGKLVGPQGSSLRVPLMLSEKVQRSKALVDCEGDSIDLSGDVGSVGRVVIADNPSKNHEMLLDLKGTIYRTNIVPSRTFCVVSFGQSEAKIEAIMNDYIQLKPLSNVDEAETMVEGTLDGFSFNSEDEADNPTAQAEQQEVAEEQLEGKTKREADKGVAKKNGKPAGVKPSKKVKKKPQVLKKSKAKK